MQTIADLTKEQEKRFAELKAFCSYVELSTVRCNREECNAAIFAAYRVMGAEQPKILWTNGIGSARALVAASTCRRAAVLDRLCERRYELPAECTLDHVIDDALAALKVPMGAEFDGDIVTRIHEWVGTNLTSDFSTHFFGSWIGRMEPMGSCAMTPELRSRLFEELRHRDLVRVWRELPAFLDLAHDRLIPTLSESERRSLPRWRSGHPMAGIYPPEFTRECAFNFFSHELGIRFSPDVENRHKISWDLTTGVFWIWPGSKVCICCDRPTEIALDVERRPHREDGPAVSFSDGFAAYAVHGVELPEYVVMRPHEISVEKIEAEQNAEVRRILTERFGYGRYLSETGAQVIDMDVIAVNTLDESFGSMPRALMVDKQGQRWLVGTDGSTKRVYYMRAPNDANTCAQAHSALAGFDENQIIASS